MTQHTTNTPTNSNADELLRTIYERCDASNNRIDPIGFEEFVAAVDHYTEAKITEALYMHPPYDQLETDELIQDLKTVWYANTFTETAFRKLASFVQAREVRVYETARADTLPKAKVVEAINELLAELPVKEGEVIQVEYGTTKQLNKAFANIQANGMFMALKSVGMFMALKSVERKLGLESE